MIDGDTIEVYGQRIRLHGIDAPESRQLCRQDGKPWQCGKDAANALADKIARRPVTCEDLGRDRYKRIIGKCTVAGEGMGAWMVSPRSGFPPLTTLYARLGPVPVFRFSCSRAWQS